MDYRCVQPLDSGIQVLGIRHFDAAQILDCGQCFRWECIRPGVWRGVAFGRVCTLLEQQDSLLLPDTSPGEFEAVWRSYFDLDRDYGAVKALLARDSAADRAVGFCPGMRVLRQEPWEALCTFIISQNNNIPRIRGIVERLCHAFGEPLGDGLYAFPPPERLAALEVADLAPLRSGFRAKYILDAARLVAGGDLCLEAVALAPLEEARSALQRIMGVGPKVAECALLYGMGRAECVPMDVWMKRVMERFYPDGMPGEMLPVAGLAQQYLFHYARHNPQALE